jgi:hypothetical protein
MHPQGREAVLHVHLTTAHAAPLAVAIPVTVRTASLQWREARQSEDRRMWYVTLHNAGTQDLPETTFWAMRAQTALAQVVQPVLRRGETVQLGFALPAVLRPQEAQVTLTAATRTHPVHTWQFPAQPLRLPAWPWWLYVLGGGLCVGGSMAHRWRRRRQPA